MPSVSADTTPAFRKQAIKTVLAIILFIVVYLLILGLSVWFTWICGWLVMMLFSHSLTILTIGLGLGVLFMGALVTFFLVKFIFARHKSDRSHLTEVTREEEPELFALVEDIARAVKTDFPKRIYLSTEVNAAVFYDSGFWSMFFPIRKNLLIGLGLINSVTRLELKAVLAHEFGHFSQGSMKLGSYVYNVNRVIYNMLYDNGSYQDKVDDLSRLSRYVAFFAHISIGMVQGIQWILKKIYDLINLTYSGLSREMEFHADEVAARVAGSGPLISSLLRFDLSEEAMNRVTDFYNQRYQLSVTPANIYLQHRWMMEHLSMGSDIRLTAGLPLVTEAHFERYSKSKLVIRDQWASHPGTDDRIAALNKLNILRADEKPVPANTIFRHIERWQENFTTGIFATITFPATVVREDVEAFKQAYLKEHPLYLFPDVFNGYYNTWNPALSPFPRAALKTEKALFSNEMVNLAYSLPILERDKALLHQLTITEHRIKTFDYDGVKYTMENIYTLMERIDAIIAENRAKLIANDTAAYTYFHSLAEKAGREDAFEKLIRSYAEAELRINERYDFYGALVDAVGFIDERLEFAQITRRMLSLREPEKKFKAQLAAMLEEQAYQQVMLLEQMELFAKYLSEDWVYFSEEGYNNDAVQLLYYTLNVYPALLARGRETAKLALLESWAHLMEQKDTAAIQ